jgi:hypothetical protein
VVIWEPEGTFGDRDGPLGGLGRVFAGLRGSLRIDWSFGSPVDLWGSGEGLWGSGGSLSTDWALWGPVGPLGVWGDP